MHLVRDLLDKLVVDRNGREMGRVDGIILEQHEGPPQVIALEIGPSVLGGRLHPSIGRFIAGLEHACGVGDGRPVRIAWRHVVAVHTTVKVDLLATETATGTVEKRLSAWIEKIPGAG